MDLFIPVAFMVMFALFFVFFFSQFDNMSVEDKAELRKENKKRREEIEEEIMCLVDVLWYLATEAARRIRIMYRHLNRKTYRGKRFVKAGYRF